MQNDAEEIRQVVSTWMAATKAGDTETLVKRGGKWLLARDANLLGPAGKN
jgi:ketosteroid isomerase-like protein